MKNIRSAVDAILSGDSPGGLKVPAKSLERQDKDALQLSKSKVYEVAVVSTMSSGKSTFINSLIGSNLLPSQNQACTSRTTAVLDNDNAVSPTLHLLFSNGKYDCFNDCSAEQIASVLHGKEEVISDIIIECSIPGIRNIKRSLLIVDTPGVNNSAAPSHEKITLEFLRSMSSGLIAYVINAEQIATSDDARTLKSVQAVIEKNPSLQLIFILNKADALDPEKEPIETVVSNCLRYLNDNGIASPSIFPVSSDAAMLLKMAASGARLSKAEAARANQYYEKFRPPDLRLSSFAYLPGQDDLRKEVSLGKRQYPLRDILSSLENTGIPAVEREIEKRIIDRLGSKAPKVRKPNQKRK